MKPNPFAAPKTPSSPQPERPVEQTRPWQYVVRNLLVFGLTLIVLPMFAVPIGVDFYVGLHGALFAMAASAVCLWNFFRCPNSAIVEKCVAIILSLPVLYLAIAAVLSYCCVKGIIS